MLGLFTLLAGGGSSRFSGPGKEDQVWNTMGSGARMGTGARAWSSRHWNWALQSPSEHGTNWDPTQPPRPAEGSLTSGNTVLMGDMVPSRTEWRHSRFNL